ncbi:MAG: hypothetical protein H7308_08455 [Chthonomonadaceae bacterium]|nr:hypothetical protein [Chthonomonadaceae bacterium]
MALDSLLQSIKTAIFNDDSNPYKQGDTGGLIGQIEGLFGQHQAQQGTQNNPLPASQDPYGDPADREGRGGNQQNLQQQFPGLRPASEDPLGDPADQENRR